MIDRRTFLGTAVAAGAALPAGVFNLDNAHAASTYTRYDANSDNGKAMLESYAKAVAHMKTLKPSHPHSWTFQWYTHAVPRPGKADAIARIYKNPSDPDYKYKSYAEAMWSTCASHGASPGTADWFLPWHRMYVYYFESLIRLYSGNPQFALPYWNYLNSATAGIPLQFQDKTSTLYQANRYKEINDGDPLTDLDTSSFTQPTYLQTSSTRLGFNTGLNNTLHGQVHDDVGGDNVNMATVPTAAEDPIFWLHHCEIDRLWVSWNATAPTNTNPDTSTWLNRTFSFVNDKLQLITPATSAFSDISKLDYTYDSLQSMPQPEKLPAANALALASSAPLATINNVSLAPKATRFALNVIAKPKSTSLLADIKALPGESRTFLVLSDLVSTSGDTGQFNVFVDLPEKPSAQDLAKAKIGTINFFNVSHTEHENHMAHGQFGDPNRFVFDVTAQLKASPTSELPKVTVLAKRGGSADGLTIGQIALIAG